MTKSKLITSELFDIFPKGTELFGTVIVIYAVVVNTDSTEGRGEYIDHSYHLTELEATIGASGLGIMGHDADVEPRIACRLRNTKVILLSPPVEIALIDKKVGEGLRSKALSKLTMAEKAALFGEDIPSS
ncbi:MAG: hypothetical protein KBC26_01195 [Candidatus Pacebacteria bacterium]|nr:hypothetical protein [Candidatus Paceibacterota bacterium]